jgi:hypothetical protein
MDTCGTCPSLRIAIPPIAFRELLGSAHRLWSSLDTSRIVDGAQKKYRRPSAVRNSVYALTIREHSPERVAENSELACSLPPSLLARVSVLFLRRTQETLPDFRSLHPLRPSEQQIFSTCRTQLRGAGGGGVVNLVTMRRQGPLPI